MTNWVEGFLKVRGTQENIKEFFINVLAPCLSNEDQNKKYLGEPYEEIYADIYEEEDFIRMKSPYGFYIKGTKSAFLYEDIHYDFCLDGELSVLVLPHFRQAWKIETQAYVELSRKYQVDIRIDGFERDMQFNQRIEVMNGELTIDQTTFFQDYQWESVFPGYGGAR